MEWTRTYPCLAAVMEASLETLQTWRENLPPPQNDVQRTVLRRLKARADEMGRQRIRQEMPGFADQFNAILDKMQRAGIKPPVERM